MLVTLTSAEGEHGPREEIRPHGFGRGTVRLQKGKG